MDAPSVGSQWERTAVVSEDGWRLFNVVFSRSSREGEGKATVLDCGVALRTSARSCQGVFVIAGALDQGVKFGLLGEYKTGMPA